MSFTMSYNIYLPAQYPYSTFHKAVLASLFDLLPQVHCTLLPLVPEETDGLQKQYVMEEDDSLFVISGDQPARYSVIFTKKKLSISLKYTFY